MTAPPLSQYYDHVADDPAYLAPDSISIRTTTSTTAQRRIEELELAAVVALQTQADLEYQLYVAEMERRRLDQQQQRMTCNQPTVLIQPGSYVVQPTSSGATMVQVEPFECNCFHNFGLTHFLLLVGLAILMLILIVLVFVLIR